jgi:putative flippase GtrA
VHWLGVVALVGLWGWHPLLANPVAWLLAFAVSFAGHHQLSFRAQNAPLGRALRRFLLVSAGGFAVNEAVYAALVGFSGQRYDLLLGAVLVAVAGLTYLLGRHWAFLRRAAN